MKRDKFNLFAAVCIGLLFVLLGNSCNPIVVEKPSDEYVTLTLTECKWSTYITHLSDDNGLLYTFVSVVAKGGNGNKFDPKRDSVPYSAYKFYVEAQTKDTLLPLGKYTTKDGDTGRILIKQCEAWSANSALWPKPAGRYTMKDATIYIGCDSLKIKNKYYFEFFIDMDDGERLYIRSTELWRESDDQMHQYPFYYPE